jgi:hypothetical protein
MAEEKPIFLKGQTFVCKVPVAGRTVKADTEQKAGRTLGEGSAQEVPILTDFALIYCTVYTIEFIV